MNIRKHQSRRTPFALAPLALALAWVGVANAEEYWLCAKPATLTMPDGQAIPMWGFAGGKASDGITSLTAACAASASVPGPDLVVTPGDNSLTVHLRNALTGPGAEPVSVVIPGQAMPTDASVPPVLHPPVRHGAGTAYEGRVRSFTAEAAVGGDQVYVWGNLKPGTYLYHSGTHPQVQVQMGLYGALEHDAAPGQAYAGKAYGSDVRLLFSEIDPALHTAVNAGDYGPTGLVTSTVDYAPSYFLVNGAPYVAGSTAPLAAGSAGQPTLLRLLNAGLRTRTPLLQGAHMQLIAEDGKTYPHGREQYAAMLPALKTIDALFTAPAAATYPIYDRRLAVSNPGASPGGMLAFLAVGGAPAGTPAATPDAYTTNEDTQLVVGAAGGLLANDSPAGATASLVSGPSHGGLNLLADGSFTYSPVANYSGADSFSYQAVSGGVSSTAANVSVTVNPVNDAPAAVGDAYSVGTGASLTVALPGVLANDSDVDGNPITAVNFSAPTGGTLTSSNVNGAFSYTAPASAGEYSFTYQASDGSATSAPTTVAISVVSANQAPTAVNDTARTTMNAAININVKVNDSDPDGSLTNTIQIVVPPNRGGSVSVTAAGSVLYTPALNFRGSENFGYRVMDNGGAWSNTATVRVNVR